MKSKERVGARRFLASIPVLLLALAFLGTFFFVSSTSPVVHASQPTVDKIRTINVTTLAKSITFTGIPVGDTLFVVGYSYSNTPYGCNNNNILASDTLSSAWTLAGHQCVAYSIGGGNEIIDSIGYWFTTPTQTSPYSDTITLTANVGAYTNYHLAGVIEALGSITTSAFRYTNNSVTYPTVCSGCNTIAVAVSSIPAYSSGYTLISATTSVADIGSPYSQNCPSVTCTYTNPLGTNPVNATNICSYGGATNSYHSTLCLSYTNSGGSNSYSSTFNYPTSASSSGGESAISFQGSTTNAYSTCYNSQPVCFEQQYTPAFATSGTSITDSLNSNFPNKLLANPFTEVVEVLVSGTSSSSSITPFIPSGVVSADFGSLSNTFGTGGSPNYLNFVMTNVIQQCPIIAYSGCVFPQADADSLSLSIWYVTQASGTTATSDSITVTFANNINTAANTNNHHAFVIAGFIGGTTAQIYTPYLFVQASYGIWAKSGSIQSSGGFTAATSNPTLATGNIFGSIVSTSTFSTGFTGGTGGWIDGNQCDYTSTCASGATGYVYTAVSGNGVGDYIFLDSAYYQNGMTQGAGIMNAQPYGGVAVAGALDYTITLYWTPAPTCTNCAGNGGGGNPTTSKVLDSNQTIFYFGYTSAQTSILITNITTKIYSVTTTIHSTCNSVASRICIFLGIWILPNQNSINPANPLVLDTVPSCGLIISSPTTSTPFYIHLSGISCNIPASSSYVVGLSDNHNGVDVYGSTTNAPMYNDTVDGYQPSKINSYASAPNDWIVWNWSMASLTVNVVNTVTITSGATTVTSTQYSTIFQLQTGSGGLAVSEQLVAYLPIWLFPVLLGAWFGLIGLFMGFIIGISFGTILGIVPLWMAFLLGLGIVFMMSKLH